MGAMSLAIMLAIFVTDVQDMAAHRDNSQWDITSHGPWEYTPPRYPGERIVKYFLPNPARDKRPTPSQDRDE